MAAASAIVSGYPDHPPLLFRSLLSFLVPLACSHRESGHGGKTLVFYNQNIDLSLTFPSIYPHTSLEHVPLHGRSLELSRRNPNVILRHGVGIRRKSSRVIAGSSTLPHPPFTISFQASSPLDLKPTDRE
ncbi:hypothetical protein RHMOL_Rhmol01G0133100 [Rhododendron molle]|uniref:Uncharacterized protein n=1 Tax=Rhododendron molle TaxID=49168 RepID=A0ACC0Q1K2_RHOML|nr:hypothetical protein RHMOL_Rhmol01G0133100 [Rhododendron molle]